MRRAAVPLILLMVTLAIGADPVAADTVAPAARPASPDEAAVQRALQLKRIARLKAQGRPADAQQLIPLLKAGDAEVRRQAEQAIWSIWGRSGQPEADRLFRIGVQQIERKDYTTAIDTLSRVVALAPGFAEAWNRRAAARFLSGDLVGALDDVERTITLQPDHFGSLAGYGHIYFRLDDFDRALLYWERALDINPNLEGIARSVEAVRRLQAGRGRLAT